MKNTYSLSATSLNITWELVYVLTAITYTIYYNNIYTDCFNDSGVIHDIDGSETGYTLTGLEEGSNYSIIVKAAVCGQLEAEDEHINVATMVYG